MTNHTLLSVEKRLDMTFTALDANGDGLISKEEMCVWMRYCLEFASAALQVTEDQVAASGSKYIPVEKQFLVEFVEQHKYEISYLKHVHTMDIPEQKKKREIAALAAKCTDDLFVKYDTNTDGFLSHTEFMQIGQRDVPLVIFENFKVSCQSLSI